MKRKYFTKAAGFLLKIFIGMLICAVLYLCVYGMALIGIPEAEEVERITISYSEFPRRSEGTYGKRGFGNGHSAVRFP